ncbi:MAG: hypothetical protein WEA10_03230 [Actinomycetota bacterium]
MNRRRTSTAIGVGLLTMFLAIPAVAEQEAPEHCAVFLDRSVDDADTKPVETAPIDIGCFDTLSEALVAGSAGTLHPTPFVSLRTLTDRSLDEGGGSTMDVEDPEKTFLIGIEYDLITFDGGTRSYYFDRACNANPIEVNVGDTWDDRFESGKGFAGCGSNKKFAGQNQNGDVHLCTPSCGSYNDLRNRVSSLRWKE